MAKFECSLKGDFNAVLRIIEQGIFEAYDSNFINGGDFQSGKFRCAVRVFERTMYGRDLAVTDSDYSIAMSVLLADDGDNLFISAGTSGESRVVFLKGALDSRVNKLVDRLRRAIEAYKSGAQQGLDADAIITKLHEESQAGREKDSSPALEW